MNRAAVRLPLAGAAFIALADTAIVALALPPILRELDTDVSGVAAVLGVYAIVLAAALPVAERARAALGTRLAGCGGVFLFSVGSLVCGVAESLELLLLARAVQAAGGAGVLVTAHALLTGDAVGARAWRLSALLGFAAGPALGGALTQGFGWRSIFLLQAPAALAALPACLAAAALPAARPAPAERPTRTALSGPTIGRFVSLALVSGAIAAALFLTVLMLIVGWGIDPLAAAAAVSIMPLAALAAVRVHGPPLLRAGAGCLLVAAGSASLAFLPTASVAWTVLPQIAVGVGMGLSLPALAGELLPERSGYDAARFLSIRHVGIALALLILAPIAQHEIDTTLEHTLERGAALLLDAPIDPQVKLAIAPRLAEAVETEDPRAALERVFADARGDVSEDQRPAFDELQARSDDILVAGVNDGFATAYLVAAGLALLAAPALAPWTAARRRPALAAGLTAAALLAPAGYALAAEQERPEPVRIEDPCKDRDLPETGGITGALQDTILVAADRAACRAGSSREELVLAIVDEEAADEYEERYGVDPRSVLDLGELLLPG
jgi:predicted MFS family arabinose efflux permease